MFLEFDTGSVPGANNALALASAQASTYPTMPCCRSDQNELFNFSSVLQTSACCVTLSGELAYTAACWNVRHAGANTPVTIFPFYWL